MMYKISFVPSLTLSQKKISYKQKKDYPSGGFVVNRENFTYFRL